MAAVDFYDDRVLLVLETANAQTMWLGVHRVTGPELRADCNLRGVSQSSYGRTGGDGGAERVQQSSRGSA